MTGTSNNRWLIVSSMLAKLAGKILILILPVLLLIWLLFVILPRNPASYYHGFHLKDDLLRNTYGPKIVLVGGSNVALGFDSHALSRAFSRPVINAGLHASLGSNFMLNSVELYISGPGDIVILSFEYSHFLVGASYLGDNTLCEMLFEEPSAVRYLDLGHVQTILMGMGGVCGKRLMKLVFAEPFPVNGIYNSKAFNECGDVVSHLNISPAARDAPKDLAVSPGDHSRIDAYSPAMRRLAEFIRCVQGKGSHIYIIPPCYRETEFNANASTIRKNYRLLKELYPDIVCASPDDFVFRSDCFFDTAYHLNQKGRDERTARVVACLQNRGLK
jgi:hypothetical protein